jgi:small-conductance mechanosensitive channel
MLVLDVEAATLLRTVPEQPADVQVRRALAEQQLARLDARLTALKEQEGAEPTRSPVLTELRAAWQAYLDAINRLARAQEDLSRLSGTERREEIAAQVAEVRQQTETLKATPMPFLATDEQVRKVAEEAQALAARISTLNEREANRATLKSTGFTGQQQTLEAELTELRKKKQDATQAPSNGAEKESDLDPALARLRQQRIDVLIARAEASLAALRLEQQVAEMGTQQEAQLLEALRAYSEVLRKRGEALREARGRSVIDYLNFQLGNATDPAEQAYLKMSLFRESVLLTYFTSNPRLETALGQYPPSNLSELSERISASAVTTERFLDSARERTGAEALDLRATVRQEATFFVRRRALLQSRLNEVLSVLQALQTVRDRSVTRLRELGADLSNVLAKAEPQERTRREADATALRAGFMDAMKSKIDGLSAVVGRLEEAITKIDAHLAQLSRIEQDLYTLALKRRESGLVGLPWASVMDEIEQLTSHATAGPEAEPAADTPAARILEGLFPAPTNARLVLSERLQTIRNDVARLGGGIGLTLLVGVAIFAGATPFVRRFSRRQAQELAHALTARTSADNAEVGWRMSERLNLLGWRLVGSVGTLVLAISFVIFVAWWADLPTKTWQPLAAVLGLIGGTVLAVQMVRFLFDPHRPASRVVRCGNEVSRHYRRFMSAALALCGAGLLLPIFLYLIDALPNVRQALWECVKTGLLLLAVGFASRRDRVLDILGADRHQGAGAVLTALYPLLQLGLLALLVLEVIGYGLLVEFVGVGVLVTLTALLLAFVVIQYSCDWVDRASLRRRSKREADHAGALADSVDDGMVMLSKLVIRIAALSAAAVLVLHAWGRLGYVNTINWHKVGLGMMGTLLAVGVDRVLLSTFRTLEHADRLPASISKMIRRWLRILITIVLGLYIAALAEYPIGRLWELLAGVLALVAIGFVAVWSMLSNVTATLIILVWRPIEIGEWVHIKPEDIEGEVIDINFMFVMLRDDDDVRTTIPNSLFLQKFIRRRALAGRTKRTLAEQLEAAEPLGTEEKPPAETSVVE